MTTGLLLMAALRHLCVPIPLRAVQMLPGDADCDGLLNRTADLAAVAAAPFEGSTCSAADANNDGTRTAADLPAEVRWLGAIAPVPTPSLTLTVRPTALGTATPTPTRAHLGTATPTATETQLPTPTATFSPNESATPT